MSVNDDVFFESGLPLPEVAVRLADLFGMETRQEDRERFYLGRRDFAGLPGITNTRLTTNYYSGNDLYPDEVAVYDGCDAVLVIYRPDQDLGLQQAAARVIFETIAQKLRWRAVLLHNLEFLVATWDPEHGLREYPPGTTPDAEDEALWGPDRQGS